MIRKTLEALTVILPLSTSIGSAYADQTMNYSPHSRPSVYAQVSTEVTKKDENLEKTLNVYKNLVFKQKYNKRAMKMALGFYDDIIKDNKNKSYVVEAYLNSGIILCCMTDPKDIEKGATRLEKAYDLGNETIKLDAAYYLARLNYGHGREEYPLFNFEKAKKYITEVIKRAPGSPMAEEAKAMLLQIKLIEKTEKPK